MCGQEIVSIAFSLYSLQEQDTTVPAVRGFRKCRALDEGLSDARFSNVCGLSPPRLATKPSYRNRQRRGCL